MFFWEFFQILGVAIFSNTLEWHIANSVRGKCYDIQKEYGIVIYFRCLDFDLILEEQISAEFIFTNLPQIKKIQWNWH